MFTLNFAMFTSSSLAVTLLKRRNRETNFGVLKKAIPELVPGGKCYVRAILCVIFVVLCVAFATFVHLYPPKPHRPQFVLQVNKNFNISHPNPDFLNLSIEITLSSKNPNHKTGIYYDTLNAYASYRNLQVTSATALDPETYKRGKEVIVWSPVLIGSAVYVPASLGNFSMALEKDLKEARLVPLNIKIDGSIRFKESSKVTRAHPLLVRCPPFTMNQSQDCDVEIWDFFELH